MDPRQYPGNASTSNNNNTVPGFYIPPIHYIPSGSNKNNKQNGAGPSTFQNSPTGFTSASPFYVGGPVNEKTPLKNADTKTTDSKLPAYAPYGPPTFDPTQEVCPKGNGIELHLVRVHYKLSTLAILAIFWPLLACCGNRREVVCKRCGKKFGDYIGRW